MIRSFSILGFWLAIFVFGIAGCDRGAHISVPLADDPPKSGDDGRIDDVPMKDGGQSSTNDGDASVDGSDHQPVDIQTRLEALPGVKQVRDLGMTAEGRRSFELVFETKLDHFDSADSRRFDYTVLFQHVGVDRPVVALATGYGLDTSGMVRPIELAETLNANTFVFGHRFFPGAIPGDEALDFTKVTVRQAAEDVHQMISALRTIYSGRWGGSGWSKGGMTIIFQEYFHDEDLDFSLPMVAPISVALPDPAFQAYWPNIGSAECRERIDASIRKILSDREAVAGVLLDPNVVNGDRYSSIGLAQWDWVFWQFGGDEFCNTIPPDWAPLRDHMRAILFWLGVQIPDPNAAPARFSPDTLDSMIYPLQAETELGQPQHAIESTILSYRDSGLISQGTYEAAKEMSDVRDTLIEQGFAVNEYNPQTMIDVRRWLRESATNMFAIYGEYDPWTGGKIELSEENGSYVYIAPRRSHSTMISDLSMNDREHLLTQLQPLFPDSPLRFRAEVGEESRANIRRLASTQRELELVERVNKMMVQREKLR